MEINRKQLVIEHKLWRETLCTIWQSLAILRNKNGIAPVFTMATVVFIAIVALVCASNLPPDEQVQLHSAVVKDAILRQPHSISKPQTARSTQIRSLDPEQFKTPAVQYRPIDCWWWDHGYLSQEKLKWQLEDMHAKGVGGTWLYPRFGASQPQSSEPGFFTEGWWKYVDFALTEHEHLGMQQWANDWLGRLDKNYFQSQLLAMREKSPRLMGHRLIAHQLVSTRSQPLKISLPKNQTAITAAAYKLTAIQKDIYDSNSRIELLNKITNHEFVWDAPESGWVAIIVASEPASLNYLGPEVAQKWIEIFFEHYRRNQSKHLGKSLTAYGPDERQVLNGDFLYTDALRQRIKNEKGYDPLLDLPALFIDLGPRTDKIRCDYHATMVALLEENLYEPIQRWLHNHGMKQATIATWGRNNIRGQTYNYGDFFRMMKYFDITGNEDSVQSGKSAFIDTKLSSSIAHLNSHRRVAVCAYWGTGWGFTQEQNIARTNVNFALGMNLFNTHGGLYSFMGSRNEFVPPEVHFYQPYWQTWRTFYDSVSRLSYVLSQGEHRADVAIVYPISTLHANWTGDKEERRAFLPPAREAERTMFALGESIYQNGIDFDFIDETSISNAKVAGGKLKPQQLEFSVVILPTMTTIHTEMLVRLQQFVNAGGTLIVWGNVPTASVENGRNDPVLQNIWHEMLGNHISNNSDSKANLIHPSNENGKKNRGRTILVRDQNTNAAQLVNKAITPDVKFSLPDVIYTHNQVGDQNVYYIVNHEPTKRELEITFRTAGTPEMWNPHTGKILPIHRYELLRRGGSSQEDGTRVRLEMNANEGVLLVLQPKSDGPQVVTDNLHSIDEIQKVDNGFNVIGTADTTDLTVKLVKNGQSYEGKTTVESIVGSLQLDGAWECEFQPTMNNRWGDFRYPASHELLGPEMPIVKYRTEPLPSDKTQSATQTCWQSRELDDRNWKTVKCNYGPYWQQLGPFDKQLDSADIQQQIIKRTKKALSETKIDGTQMPWQTNSYSMKHGADVLGVHQQSGDDGLGAASENFLVLDRLEGKESVCYLTTSIVSAQPKTMYLHFGNPGDRLVRQAWVNGERIVNVDEKDSEPIAKALFKQGENNITLRIQLPVRDRKGERLTEGIPPLPPSGARVDTYAVFLNSPELPVEERFLPLMRWHKSLPQTMYDCYATTEESIGWFRFPAPPGVRRAKLNLNSESVQAWINGEKAEVVNDELQFPKAAKESTTESQVTLRVKHKRGFYEGAAFDQPVQFVTARGKMPTGDWSLHGLAYYSGGLTYIKAVSLNEAQMKCRIVLDLGDVRTSAEVLVNGKLVDTQLARPFRFDVTQFVKPGENEIRVKVLNTLANYMSSQPTRYVYKGQTVSGMLGPVTLQFYPRAKVPCKLIAH